MHYNPNCDMKFISVYQNNLAKFVFPLSLHSTRADEEAYYLLDIFTTFEVPSIIHLDNGTEFYKTAGGSGK